MQMKCLLVCLTGSRDSWPPCTAEASGVAETAALPTYRQVMMHRYDRSFDCGKKMHNETEQDYSFLK